jgi:hypothetical protein
MPVDSKTDFEDEPEYRDIHIGMWLKRGAAIGEVLRSVRRVPRRVVTWTHTIACSTRRRLSRLHQWALSAVHFKNRHA